MENNRFLLDSDYLEVITKEALGQIIQPGDEHKFAQAEESAEMSILENLVENYEIENELMKGKSIRKYDPRINYPVGVYIQYDDNIYKVIRSISGYKVPTDKVYWEESTEIQEIVSAPPYSQLMTYRPGDLVCYNEVVFECVEENGYEFDNIRVPLSNCWEKTEPLEWTPTPFKLYDPVSYDSKFYQLYELADYDETISPDLLPQCWGEILPYDSSYNNYELSPHELVAYEGKVFYPILNVNSDTPEIGNNLVLEDPRHKNIKKHMVRLALYELTKNISPNNVSVTRANDYETSMAWLRDANRLKINPMIPRKVDGTGSPSIDWGIATFQKSYDPYLNPWQV